MGGKPPMQLLAQNSRRMNGFPEASMTGWNPNAGYAEMGVAAVQ
jgi:hypothetical protein